MVEQLSGNVSTFTIQAAVPAISQIHVRIRDAGFQLDTVVITGSRKETLHYAKSYPGAVQPVFSISIVETCPNPINVKDSLNGVLTRVTTGGAGLQVELPEIADPYDIVKAELNDSVITAIPTPYQNGTYQFPGITGCRKKQLP